MVDLVAMPDFTPKVLVTEPEYRKGESSYAAAPDLECICAPEIEEALASAIHDSRARYVIVGNRKYSGPLYDALPSGGVIARMGCPDGMTRLLRQRASVLTNTPCVPSIGCRARDALIAAAARGGPRWRACQRLTAAPGLTYGKRLYHRVRAHLPCARAIARLVRHRWWLHDPNAPHGRDLHFGCYERIAARCATLFRPPAMPPCRQTPGSSTASGLRRWTHDRACQPARAVVD